MSKYIEAFRLGVTVGIEIAPVSLAMIGGYVLGALHDDPMALSGVVIGTLAAVLQGQCVRRAAKRLTDEACAMSRKASKP